MPRNITTQGETLQDLHNLATSVAANSAEVPHLESPRTKLEALLGEAWELIKLQADLAAKRQEASRRLRELITEGRRLGNFLRVGLREHFGPRSEKLSAFRILPFRGFKPEKPEEPAAPAVPQQQIP
jgi:hypothetical protein